MWVGMVRGGHSSGGPADLETLRKETRLEIQLEKLPGGVWLKAHWEVRLAAVHVEAQRKEARYTVLGALSRSPAAPPNYHYLASGALYHYQNTLTPLRFSRFYYSTRKRGGGSQTQTRKETEGKKLARKD